MWLASLLGCASTTDGQQADAAPRDTGIDLPMLTESIDVPEGDEVVDVPAEQDVRDAPVLDLAEGRCSNPDYPQEGWKRGDCACLGALPERPGVCRTGLLEPFELGFCSRGSCFETHPNAPSWCVVLDLARGFTGECAREEFCRAAAELSLRPPQYPRAAGCYYADGTPFATGRIVPQSCPSGEGNLFCAPGCGLCAQRACWGSSEENPLGYCVDHTSLREDYPCHETRACRAGHSCLRPNNLNTVGQYSSGLCVPTARCTLAAERSEGRFRCEPQP